MSQQQNKSRAYKQSDSDITISEYVSQLEAKGKLGGQIFKWKEKMERDLQHIISEYSTPNGKMIKSPFKPDERTGSFHADANHAKGFKFSCFATGIRGAGVIDFQYYLENPVDKPISPEERDEFIINYAARNNYEFNYSVSSSYDNKYNYVQRVKDLRSAMVQFLTDNEILVPRNNLNNGICQLSPDIGVNNVQSVIDMVKSNFQFSLDVEEKHKAENKSDFNLNRMSRHIKTIVSDTSEMLIDLAKIPANKPRSVLLMEDKGVFNNIYNIETGIIELSLSENESRKLPIIDFDIDNKLITESLRSNGALVVTNDYRSAYSLMSNDVVAATLPMGFKQLTLKSQSENINQHSPKFPLIDAISSLSIRVNEIHIDDELKTFTTQADAQMLYMKSAVIGLASSNKVKMINVVTQKTQGINDYIFNYGADLFIPMYDPRNPNNIVSSAKATQEAQAKFKEILTENEKIAAYNREIGEKNKGKPFKEWANLRKKELPVPISNFGREAYNTRINQVVAEIRDVYIKNRAVNEHSQQAFIQSAKSGALQFSDLTYHVTPKPINEVVKPNTLTSDVDTNRVVQFNAQLNARFEANRNNPYFQEFLQQRGLVDAIDSRGQLLYEKFGLGYSDGTEAAKLGYDKSMLYSAGLTSGVPSGLMLEKRITFNIKDVNDNIISFAGRVIKDHTPEAPNEDISTVKYRNGSNAKVGNDKFVFDKNVAIYGIKESHSAIMESDTIYITEGYMDCIACHAAGIENAVAAMGTAFSREKMSEAYSYANNVVMMFDGDKAGMEKAMRAAEIFLSDTSFDETIQSGGKQVKTGKKIIQPCLYDGVRNFQMVLLPKLPTFGHNDNIKKGIDPDEYIQQFGAAALKEEMANALNLDEIMVMNAYYHTFEKDKTAEQKLSLLNDEFAYVEFNAHIERNLEGVKKRIGYAERRLNSPKVDSNNIEVYQNMIESCQSFIESTLSKSKEVLESIKWLRSISLKESLPLNEVYELYGNDNVENRLSRILFKELCEPVLAKKYEFLAEEKIRSTMEQSQKAEMAHEKILSQEQEQSAQHQVQHSSGMRRM